jgi:hypothetical protein
VIRDHSPAQLTCPRCLAPIRNPYPLAARPVPDAATHARPIPVTPLPTGQRVLPYRPPTADYEAHTDQRGSVVAIAVLVVCLAAGSFLSFANGNAGMGAILLLATVLAAAIPLHYFHQQRQGLDPSAASAAGFQLVRGCAAAVVIFFGVIALLLGLCAAVVGGGALFHL